MGKNNKKISSEQTLYEKNSFNSFLKEYSSYILFFIPIYFYALYSVYNYSYAWIMENKFGIAKENFFGEYTSNLTPLIFILTTIIVFITANIKMATLKYEFYKIFYNFLLVILTVFFIILYFLPDFLLFLYDWKQIVSEKILIIKMFLFLVLSPIFYLFYSKMLGWLIKNFTKKQYKTNNTYFERTVLCILLVFELAVLFPIVSEFFAKKYEGTFRSDVCEVIIHERANDVIVMKCKVGENNDLTICKDNYSFKTKENMVVEYKEFSNVSPERKRKGSFFQGCCFYDGILKCIK